MVIERNTERFDLNCPLLVDWKAWHIWACWRVQREQQILSSLTRFEFETGDEMFSGRLSVAGERIERARRGKSSSPIGRAHVGTPVTHAHLVCRILLENEKIYTVDATQHQINV